MLLGAVAANGLYTAGGWILQAVSFRLRGFPLWLSLLGLVPWAAGTAMAVAAAIGRFEHMETATMVLVPTFCLWTVGVAEFYFARANHA